MDESFILSVETKVRLRMPVKTSPALNAARILRRDIKKALVPAPSGSARSEIELSYAGGKERMKPETYALRFSENEKGDRLTVVGADELGLIYGVLFISSEYLKIPPFWFWNDFKPEVTSCIRILKRDIISKPCRVRYRGWFVNDEMLLLGWKKDKYEKNIWRAVFEALLRCGGNMVIPGTGESVFANEQLAADMGLMLTHHHAEPLGAELFLSAYPDQDPNYQKNFSLFEKLWEQGVIRQKDKNVIWALGFRGQGDRPFWEDDPSFATPEARGEQISRIIKRQYEILCRHVENPVCCTYLYGEIMRLYRDGYVRFPEGVIKIWADNGYGKMVSRRQENSNPRVCALPAVGDAGPHGLYYHVTFHDLQTSNHLTMEPNSPEMIGSELEKAFAAGADQYFILNCGNVRPHTYMLDLVAEMWKGTSADIDGHLERFVNTYYRSCRQDVVQSYRRYFQSTVRYGENDDDRAGDEFYHYITRILFAHWIQNRTEETEERLLWATGQADFARQVNWYAGKCAEGAKSWKATNQWNHDVFRKLDSSDRTLFSDSLMLQTALHETGCRGGLEFCRSFSAFQKQDYFHAYLHACASMEAYREGLGAMKKAEHDKWACFYRNDCLTNVKLTVYCMDTLRRYIRAFGDGTEFLDWEKEYLYPESQKRIMLETTYTNQLTDDELYRQIKEFIRPESGRRSRAISES